MFPSSLEYFTFSPLFPNNKFHFTLITSSGIVELIFLKHGWPRSKKTQHADRQGNSYSPEQWEDRNAPIIAYHRDINGAV